VPRGHSACTLDDPRTSRRLATAGVSGAAVHDYIPAIHRPLHTVLLLGADLLAYHGLYFGMGLTVSRVSHRQQRMLSRAAVRSRAASIFWGTARSGPPLTRSNLSVGLYPRPILQAAHPIAGNARLEKHQVTKSGNAPVVRDAA
jgi:hypothetical protein